MARNQPVIDADLFRWSLATELIEIQQVDMTIRLCKRVPTERSQCSVENCRGAIAIEHKFRHQEKFWRNSSIASQESGLQKDKAIQTGLIPLFHSAAIQIPCALRYTARMYFDEQNIAANSMAPATVLSVTSLNRLARDLLERNFPAVIVEGEISNLAQPASGHWYLTLKDRNSQIRCAMFSNRNRLVRFKPQNGNQVIIKGRLSIYEGRGDYQLLVDNLEEAGDGALRRAFEELKAKLHAEGLFDPANKQAILTHYQHIGVITSATGAAIRDVLSVFARRFPATRITLFPVAVQGKDAPAEIVRAITLANRLRDKLQLQALIVGRGGGSLEDLQAFNEETVARAIFASELPLTSAVGHEIDFTIADFVADLRAPTPSAAAELMSPDQQEYLATYAGYEAQLTSQITQVLRTARQQLTWLARQLKHPGRRLQEQAQHLDRLEAQLQRAMRNRLLNERSALTQLRRNLLSNSPTHMLRRSALTLAHNRQRLQAALQASLTAKRASIAALGRSLGAVSPLQTLARGYSITYDSNAQVLRQSDAVEIGSTVTTRLNQGRIESRVTAVLQHDQDIE